MSCKKMSPAGLALFALLFLAGPALAQSQPQGTIRQTLARFFQLARQGQVEQALTLTTGRMRSDSTPLASNTYFRGLLAALGNGFQKVDRMAIGKGQATALLPMARKQRAMILLASAELNAWQRAKGDKNRMTSLLVGFYRSLPKMINGTDGFEAILLKEKGRWLLSDLMIHNKAKAAQRPK